MSLRSGSPCTSTSRPISSWSRITRSISPRIRSRYCGLVDLAVAQAHARLADLGRLRERADRRGREERQPEPLVLRLAPLGERRSARRASASVICARRSRTAGLRVRGDSSRSSSALRFASSAAATASSPSLSARASVATSSSFWTANDIQLSTSSSRRGSLRLSIGECCSEQEVETTTSLARPARAGPAAARGCGRGR